MEPGTQDSLFLGIVTTDIAIDAVYTEEKSQLTIKLRTRKLGKQSDVLCKVDPGDETNIMPVSVPNKIAPNSDKLGTSTEKLNAYGSSPITNLGSCELYAQDPHHRSPIKLKFEVTDVTGPTWIGSKSSQALNFEVSANEPLSKERVLKEYKDVFTGIG